MHFLDGIAWLINWHQAGGNMIHPSAINEYVQAWTEEKLSAR